MHKKLPQKRCTSLFWSLEPTQRSNDSAQCNHQKWQLDDFTQTFYQSENAWSQIGNHVDARFV